MARKAKAPEPLAEYVRKRDFTATPEPKGSKRGASQALRFVVQKHRASRLHYDFRLEAGGVLASWAIPKGPTLDTHERRLAMHVEDHPYDYRTFEGVIPKGNYGAGEVIVWDEGTYKLAEGDDPAAEIAKGKIKFILRGKKLHGMFTLVKIKNKPGESGEPWLLIKDHDEFVEPGYDINEHGESAKTGQTIEDIAGNAKAKRWQSNRAAAPAAKRAARSVKADPFPRDVKVMLATLVDKPFDDPEWVFEVKWDGFRALAAIDAKGAVTLTSRNGLDLLKRFKELGSMGAAFRSLPVLVDGEICALDKHGRSSFQALQQVDMNVGGKGRPPLTYVAFDLLYADGRDLRDEPLEARKNVLEGLIADHGLVMYSKHIVGKGKAFFGLVRRRGLEGMIAKRRDSRYEAKRSREWLKIKAHLEQELVIGGWTDPQRTRVGFGSLLLGAYSAKNGKKRLEYAGNVGTGFTESMLRRLHAALEKMTRSTSPFAEGDVLRGAHYVEPKLVAQIRFAEWTRDGLVRQAAFLGMRTDKSAKDVVREIPK